MFKTEPSAWKRQVRSALVCAVFAVAAHPVSASAQVPYDPSFDLELFRGTVAASSQIVGKGGAVAGIAEGTAVIQLNPAAVANRYVYELDDWFEWDGTLNWVNEDVGDLENRGGVTAGNTRVTNAGLHVNLERFGIGATGAFTRTTVCSTAGTTVAECADDELVFFRSQLFGAALGYPVWDDQLVLGAWFVGGLATMSAGGESAALSGQGLVFGVIWRPHGERFRLGSTFRTQLIMKPGSTELTTIGTGLTTPLQIPNRVVAPYEVTTGASFMFGAGILNPRPTFGDDYDKELAESRKPIPRRYVQIAFDVVLIGPSKNAVGPSGWLAQEVDRAGEAPSLSLRAGVESEFWANRMKARLGTYYEPSRYGSFDGRVHGTAGFDFRLFKLYWDFRLTGALDIAPNYLKYGLSVGVWH